MFTAQAIVVEVEVGLIHSVMCDAMVPPDNGCHPGALSGEDPTTNVEETKEIACNDDDEKEAPMIDDSKRAMEDSAIEAEISPSLEDLLRFAGDETALFAHLAAKQATRDAAKKHGEHQHVTDTADLIRLLTGGTMIPDDQYV